MNKVIHKSRGIKGELTVPGDKSISIRSVLFGSIAEGVTCIKGLGSGGDVRSAVSCMRQLGIKIDEENSKTIIRGNGLYGLQKQPSAIDVGNSGTTIRLLSGILAGQKFSCEITGDESIRRRPMKRIIEPLQQMEADIKGTNEPYLAPIIISGKKLKSIHYKSPVASAQVKSCIMLAGLFADGTTYITEPYKSRDHSERMLSYMNVPVGIDGTTVSIEGGNNPSGSDIFIPGDISSGAFLIVAALLIDDSDITIKNVGINPTRTGIIDVLRQMGGHIEYADTREVNNEPVTDIHVKTSRLRGIEISGEMIPRVIDEVPVIAVAAALAEGETVIKDAEELRVKETDRITAVVSNLEKMGVPVEELPDGMIIRGPNKLKGTEIESFNDHRIALSFTIGGLTADEKTVIKNAQWADISFPGFFEMLGL
ncbi:3-phosphoshikimate 1-carboxyvinyltransferase [candidate division KSB1 bacterium]